MRKTSEERSPIKERKEIPCGECLKNNLVYHAKVTTSDQKSNSYRVSQKKLSLYVLLHISGTKEQIYKPFVSAEN